jgi:hypothetical protein
MEEPSIPTAEEQYARLFPGQAIPKWALATIKLMDDNGYVRKHDAIRTVPLALIVGTTHALYGNSERWLDMLKTKKRYNFRSDNWPGFLSADTSTLELIQIAGTEEYYISGEGNHRISALKLAGRYSITCSVQIATPVPPGPDVYPDPRYANRTS